MRGGAEGRAGGGVSLMYHTMGVWDQLVER